MNKNWFILVVSIGFLIAIFYHVFNGSANYIDGFMTPIWFVNIYMSIDALVKHYDVK